MARKICIALCFESLCLNNFSFSSWEILLITHLCHLWSFNIYFFKVTISFSVILTSKSSSDSIVWLWIEPIMSYTFGSLWVIPLFWLSKILNSLWFLVSAFFKMLYFTIKQSNAKITTKLDIVYIPGESENKWGI